MITILYIFLFLFKISSPGLARPDDGFPPTQCLAAQYPMCWRVRVHLLWLIDETGKEGKRVVPIRVFLFLDGTKLRSVRIERFSS